MVAVLEATNAVLPSPLYADPMLPLAVTLAIFKPMLDSKSIVLKDKEQVSKVGNYFAEWLATVATLVDNSMPAVMALYDAILCGKGGRWRGSAKTTLFDITYRLSHRILHVKLVKLNRDVHLYLTMLIVATMAWAAEALAMLEGMKIMTMTRKTFDSILFNMSGNSYNN